MRKPGDTKFKPLMVKKYGDSGDATKCIQAMKDAFFLKDPCVGHFVSLAPLNDLHGACDEMFWESSSRAY